MFITWKQQHWGRNVAIWFPVQCCHVFFTCITNVCWDEQGTLSEETQIMIQYPPSRHGMYFFTRPLSLMKYFCCSWKLNNFWNNGLLSPFIATRVGAARYIIFFIIIGVTGHLLDLLLRGMECVLNIVVLSPHVQHV